MGSIIGGKPQCGKTTELIKKSSKEWLYIIVANSQKAFELVKMAESMNLDIPYPITFDELPIKPGSHIRGVLIDEVEQLLMKVTSRPVITMSTSYEMNEYEGVKEIAEIGASVQFEKNGQILDLAVEEVFEDYVVVTGNIKVFHKDYIITAYDLHERKMRNIHFERS